MGVFSTMAGLAGSFAATAARRLRRGPKRADWGLREEAIFTRMQAIFAPLAGLDPAGQRALLAAQAVPTPVLRKVRIEPLNDGPVRGEWITPKLIPTARTVVYLHGGGYVAGSPATHRELGARISLASEARVLMVDYRLAPEHRFPAAHDDAVAAVRHVLAQGVAPGRLVVAGDSAGGALALAALVALRDAGEPLPAGGALISPAVDLSLSGRSMSENAPYDCIQLDLARSWVRHYLGTGDVRDPRCSPTNADLAGLPPLLIQAGSAEALVDDAIALAEKGGAAGLQITLHVAPGMVHDFHLLAALLPQARAAIRELGAFVREVTSGPARPKRPVDAGRPRVQR